MDDFHWHAALSAIGPEIGALIHKISEAATGVSLNGQDFMFPERRSAQVMMVAAATCCMAAMKVNIRLGILDEDTMCLVNRLALDVSNEACDAMVAAAGGTQ
jgi:hypothetical protein